MSAPNVNTRNSQHPLVPCPKSTQHQYYTNPIIIVPKASTSIYWAPNSSAFCHVAQLSDVALWWEACDETGVCLCLGGWLTSFWALSLYLSHISWIGFIINKFTKEWWFLFLSPSNIGELYSQLVMLWLTCPASLNSGFLVPLQPEFHSVRELPSSFHD
jgi:hypothetical protein